MSENNRTIPTAVTFRTHTDIETAADETRFDEETGDADDLVVFFRLFPVCLEAGIAMK